MRVLVTGSRTWSDPEPIRDMLRILAQVSGDLTVVHGGARGADAIAAAWVDEHRDRLAVREELHLADWNKHGRRAGILRNEEMVRLGADLCLAFIRDDSRGATHCARIAEGEGIETRVLRWEGL